MSSNRHKRVIFFLKKKHNFKNKDTINLKDKKYIISSNLENSKNKPTYFCPYMNYIQGLGH